jgi:uncharacterized protein (TIGR03067 family)
MRTRTLTATAICLCLAAFAPAEEKEKKKSDADKMEGTWQAVSVQISGVPLPDEIVTNLKYVIKGNKMTTVGVPEIIAQYAEATFKLDPSTKPKSMDVTCTAGEKKGDQMEAIYEFKGDDELRLCVQIVGKERPGEFATKEGDNRGLLVLKREKK